MFKEFGDKQKNTEASLKECLQIWDKLSIKISNDRNAYNPLNKIENHENIYKYMNKLKVW